MRQNDLFEKLVLSCHSSGTSLYNSYSWIFIDEEKRPHIKGVYWIKDSIHRLKEVDDRPLEMEFKFVSPHWVKVSS